MPHHRRVPTAVNLNRLECYYDYHRPNSVQLMLLPPPPLVQGPPSCKGSTSGTWTYTHAPARPPSSLLDHRERIRPERGHRHNVQKMQWRNSRWVRGFPEPTPDYGEIDSRLSSMTIADVSPRLAVKKVILLYENQQYREAANFINRLSHGTFKVILHDLPLDLFVENMPASLPILEALYAKVFLSEGLDFSLKLLRPEGVVMQMVRYFSTSEQALQNLTELPGDATNPVVSSCKKLLKVIVLTDPKLKKLVQQRRRTLDKAIEGLGAHGMVGTSDESLLPLHDALKVEFQKVVEAYKGALAKLEELALANKAGTKSVAHGPAPIQASHQRQLSLKQEEIQERLIKNKTLLNVVEPTLNNHSLDILLGILQRRIEYDKDVLFQFTQMKKEVKDVDANAIVAPVLMRYSHGCEQVLDMMREMAEDDEEGDSSDISGYHSDSDSAIMMSGNSPFISKLARYNFLSRSVRSTGRTGVRPPLLISSSGVSSGSHTSGSSSDTQLSSDSKGDSPLPSPSPVSTPTLVPANNLKRLLHNGHGVGPTRLRHLKHKKELQKLNSAGSTSSAGSVVAVDPSTMCNCTRNTEQGTRTFRMQIEALREELGSARGAVVTLQQRERLLMERLSEQVELVQAQNKTTVIVEGPAPQPIPETPPVVTPESHAAQLKVQLLQDRISTLVTNYASLYAQARVDTLDALDSLTEMKETEELKSKILFSVVVLAFRSVQVTLNQTRTHVRRLLQMPPPSLSSEDTNTDADELEEAISRYLTASVGSFDLTRNVEEVCSQIWATLYDYPCLKNCDGLVKYIKNCVRLAWGLSNQTPPFVLEYENRIFDTELHVRFHLSDHNSEQIQTYLWPALLKGHNGPCVHKAVIIT